MNLEAQGKLPRIAKLGFAGVSAMLLLACAAPRLGTLKAGEEISIVAAPVVEASTLIDVSGKHIVSQDASTGFSSGALAGAALGALTCGPFFFLCIPVGAVIYGTAGLGVGAVVGMAQLPAEERDKLAVRMAEFSQRHEPRHALVEAIGARANDHWKLANGSASNVISVRFNEIGLQMMKEDRVALIMKVAVSVSSPGRDADDNASVRVFEYVGSTNSTRSWIDDRNDFVANSFKHGYRQIAENLCTELLE